MGLKDEKGTMGNCRDGGRADKWNSVETRKTRARRGQRHWSDPRGSEEQEETLASLIYKTVCILHLLLNIDGSTHSTRQRNIKEARRNKCCEYVFGLL